MVSKGPPQPAMAEQALQQKGFCCLQRSKQSLKSRMATPLQPLPRETLPDPACQRASWMGGLPHHTPALEGKAESRNGRSLSISARLLSACPRHTALKSQQAANRDNSLCGSDVCLGNSRKTTIKQIPDVRRGRETTDGASTTKMLLLGLAVRGEVKSISVQGDLFSKNDLC